MLPLRCVDSHHMWCYSQGYLMVAGAHRVSTVSGPSCTHVHLWKFGKMNCLLVVNMSERYIHLSIGL